MRENPQDLENKNYEAHQTFIQKDVFILKKPLDFNPDSFKEKLKDLRKTHHTTKLNRGKVFIFYVESYDNKSDPKNIELYTYEETESQQEIDGAKFEKIEIAEKHKIFTTAIYAKHFLQKSERNNDRQTSIQRAKETIDYGKFLKNSEEGPFEVDLDAYITLGEEGTTPKKYVSLKLTKIPLGKITNAPCEAIFGNLDNIELSQISEVLKKLQISHGSIFDSFNELEANKSLKKFFETSNLTYYLTQAEEHLYKIMADAKKSNEENSNDKNRIVVDEILKSKLTQDQENQTDQPPEAQKADQHTQTPVKVAGLQDDSQSDTDDQESGVKRFSRTSSIASNFPKEEDRKKPSSTPSITGTNHLTRHSIDHDHIYTKLRKDELQNYLQEFATRTIHAHADDRYMPQSFKIKPESEYAGFGLKIECDYSSNTLCIIGQNNSKNYVSRLDSEWPSCGEKFEGNIELFFRKIEDFYKVSRKDKKPWIAL